MSKAVLVLDMPKSCIDCPCHFAEENGMVYCGVMKKGLLSDDIETYKPDWCPLRELPEKAYHEYYCDNGRYDRGWNACIDAITGGAE